MKKTIEMKESTYRIIKVICLVFALIIAYLFALNNRYERLDDEIAYDKWTNKMTSINYGD